MQEYLLLVHGKAFQDESPESLKRHLDNYNNWVEELLKQDQFISGSRLQMNGNVILDGNTIVSDGPYLESKEIVGGYILIRAENLESATQIAKQCPLSREFPLSIRPMYVYN